MGNSKKGNSRGCTAVDKEVGARLKQRRIERKISQVVLAEKVGLTFQQIQKYEQGTNRIAASTLVALAEALETSIADLVPFGASKSTMISEDSPELFKIRMLMPELSPTGRATLLIVARSLLAAEKSQLTHA